MNCLKLLRLSLASQCVQQTRNTWVLRRRIPPKLCREWISPYIVGDHVKDVNPPQPQHEELEIYEVISKPGRYWPDTSIVLLEYVENLGVAGDIVTIDCQRARWELIMPGRAVYASAFNLEYYKELISKSEKSTGPSSAIVNETMKRLRLSVFPLTLSSKVPWTVEKWHVSSMLRRHGVVISEECIELPETPISGPDPNIIDKVFLVSITINGKEKVNVRCCILEHGPVQRDPFWHTGKKESILPEQKELIDEMPFEEPPPKEIVDDFD